MKAYLLFDASAVIHYFYEKETYSSILNYFLKCRESQNAFFFIPSFCIVEVINTLAKYRYRYKVITEKEYEEMKNKFLEWVHNRKFMYSYDLSRYHNLNSDDIAKIEHTTFTEYHYLHRELFDGPAKTRENEKIRTQVLAESEAKHISLSKFYLSTFDILIIAMGMELRKIHTKKSVFIVTKDKRLANICKAGFKIGCSKVINIKEDTLETVKRHFKDTS